MATDYRTSNQRLMLAAIQAVAGTPTTLVAATHSQLVLDGKFSFETDKLERAIDLTGHGSRPFLNVKRRAMFAGGCELRGHATIGNAAPIGPLLRGCGFSQTLSGGVSATYALVTTGHEMLTIRGYDSGQAVTGIDSRGVLKKLMFKVREYAKAEFEIMGLPPVKGTAVSSTTNAVGYAIAATTITLASAGTGTILAGDYIRFAGQTTSYLVATGDADVSNGGTVVLAAPGLVAAIPAAATAITVCEPIIVDLDTPSGTFTAFQAPVALETETMQVLIGATELNATNVDIDTGAEVEIYEGSRERSVRQKTLYKPSGTLTITKEYRSDFDPEVLALANTLSDFTVKVNGGGELQTWLLKGTQLGIPKLASVDELAHWEIPFTSTGTTTVDCLAVVFSAAV